MRHRDLAAIAVTATVAATPTLATVMEDVTTAPPAAADTSPTGYVLFGQVGECVLGSPGLDQNRVYTTLTFGGGDGGAICSVPGTLSLQSSGDHTHWKTLAQTHQSSWSKFSPGSVDHQCLSGTSWYQGYFVADDGSFKGGTDSESPTQFTC
jgi:hypothetical protein